MEKIREKKETAKRKELQSKTALSTLTQEAAKLEPWRLRNWRASRRR